MRVYGLPISGSHTWRRPNRSKWLIRKVTTRTVPHPAAKSVQSTARTAGSVTVQMGMPIGCHFQNSAMSARLAKSTNVERSIGHGTNVPFPMSTSAQGRQRVQYVRASDGTRLAWADSGAGPPVVKAANWLTHLEYEWESPVWKHWIQFFSQHWRFIRFDERGCG